MTPRILTIGVYGFDENSFFNSLINAKVDTFCDIRARRGMRGSQYSFVNNNFLQNKLKLMGVKYYHLKYLAPSETIRSIQRTSDANEGIAKRNRDILSPEFVAAYQEENLGAFDAKAFLSSFENIPEALVFFCVERDPQACHRSIVARILSEQLSITVEDIFP